MVFVVHHLVCGGVDQALFDLICLLDKDRFAPCVFVQNPGGTWEGKFREAGIELIYDYSCRKPTRNPVVKVQNLANRLKVSKAYRQGGEGLLDICCPDADIVVAYDVWENEPLVFKKGARTVRYVHGDIGTFESYREDILKTRDSLVRYDRIVCVSDAAWHSFCSLSGLNQGVVMLHNPINSDHVRKLAEKPTDLPDDLPMICSVGRLAPEKGLERLLLVQKKILDQGVDHRLVIVGDGPDRSFLERLARALGTEDRVIFAGYQENPYPYMKKSRFLVNSSFTEGLPVIAMEAISLGVPIVATIPSVREAFGEENCGLITANDQQSLMEGICRMLTDEDYYETMKSGAEKQSKVLDGRAMARKVEQMFFQLVPEKG